MEQMHSPKFFKINSHFYQKGYEVFVGNDFYFEPLISDIYFDDNKFKAYLFKEDLDKDTHCFCLIVEDKCIESINKKIKNFFENESLKFIDKKQYICAKYFNSKFTNGGIDGVLGGKLVSNSKREALQIFLNQDHLEDFEYDPYEEGAFRGDYEYGSPDKEADFVEYGDYHDYEDDYHDYDDNLTYESKWGSHFDDEYSDIDYSPMSDDWDSDDWEEYFDPGYG